ncbi:hypothetical protein [Streptomyces fagopyri]|uniref:hypothetical protein n=1 Tax=Streptomyces fagopyri TaxID=2662397 RepID=UPI0034054D1D
MEQRIGSKSQPLDAAAVNPAYIPGLTSPAAAEPKGAVVEEAASDEAAVEDVAPEEEVSAETPTESEEDADSEPESDPEPDPDGPVFEASDRRASIRADHGGVRLRLDDQEAEFRWDEIGAVETESPRFGKRFTITVHTPDRRWYPIEIEATARARFKEWEEQLDAVLDAYFEEGAPEEDTPEGDASAEDASVEGVEEAGTEDASAKDASAKDGAAKDASVNDTSAEDTSAKETPAKETSAKETPAKETPAEEAP